MRIAVPPAATGQVDAIVDARGTLLRDDPSLDKVEGPPTLLPLPRRSGAQGDKGREASSVAGKRQEIWAADSADVPVFALAEAIAIGLRDNPRLRVAAEAVERARGESTSAFAPFLPEMDVFSRVGGTSETLSPGAPGPVGGILAASEGARGFQQAEVDLQWTIYDFGRRSGRYNRAISRERAVALQLVRAKQTVAFDVAAAYLGLLRAYAAREVQEQAIRRARAALDDAEARRKAGVAERDDILRAELLVAEARDAAIAATRDEYDAVVRLNYTMGRNPGLPLRVVRLQDQPASGRSLEESLRTAATRRPEVAAAAEVVGGARSGLEATEGEFWPRIYIRLGVGNVSGEGVRTGWHEGGSVHLDHRLYTGGRRTGERDAARADVRAAVAAADVLFDSVALEVHVAFRAVAAAADRIRLAEAAVAQAAEYLRLVRVRYRNGNATPTDLVDAETAATRSDLRYQSAVYEHLTALARLDYATGADGAGGSCAGAQPAELLPPRPLP